VSDTLPWISVNRELPEHNEVVVGISADGGWDQVIFWNGGWFRKSTGSEVDIVKWFRVGPKEGATLCMNWSLC